MGAVRICRPAEFAGKPLSLAFRRMRLEQVLPRKRRRFIDTLIVQDVAFTVLWYRTCRQRCGDSAARDERHTAVLCCAKSRNFATSTSHPAHDRR